MDFQYPEDEKFFEELLCTPGSSLERFSDLFDFRNPRDKRREFNCLRHKLLIGLMERFGSTCMLKIALDCDASTGLQIDHLIPLSSNTLNKQLRGLGCSRSINGVLSKATTQSFGSNAHRNLILACHNCNSLKKHLFLPGEKLRELLADLTIE